VTDERARDPIAKFQRTKASGIDLAGLELAKERGTTEGALIRVGVTLNRVARVRVWRGESRRRSRSPERRRVR
jgi:hypothetical protein